jgi:hypothetical protein
LDELAEATPCGKMVGRVLALGRLDDADALGDAFELLGDVLGVRPAGLVAVADNDDVRAAQRIAVFVPPLSRAARVRGRDGSDLGQELVESVAVLLALRDPDRRGRRWSR